MMKSSMDDSLKCNNSDLHNLLAEKAVKKLGLFSTLTVLCG
jgi:hypothetical protein